MKRWEILFDPNKDYGSFQDREISYGDVLGEPGGGEWNKTLSGFTYKNIFLNLIHGQLIILISFLDMQKLIF